jgi:subtilisin family serine protease
VVAACADRNPSEVVEPELDASVQATLNPDGAPFYYFQGERISLVIDTERLIIKSSEPAGRERAAAMVKQTLGWQVQLQSPRAARPDHQVLRLDHRVSVPALRAVAESLRRTEGIEFASLAYHTVDGGHEFVPLNRIMVEFASGTTETQIDEINSLFGTRTVQTPNPDSALFFHILEFPKGLDREPMELVAELYEHEWVKWADVDKITDRRLASTPTDSYYLGFQYYLYNTYKRNGVRVDVNVETAWQVTKGGGVPSAGGMRIAVIDDGVDASHSDLNVSFLGYDGFGNNTIGCSDCAFAPYGNDIHGTAVAGIIGAQHDGVGSVGIAPDATIIPIRIFRNSSHPNPSLSQWAGEIETVRAIDFAWYWADAHIINNSWGGGAASDAITSAITRAYTSGRGGLGTVVIFAAGNSSNRAGGYIGRVDYPAKLAFFHPVLSVGAINRYGEPTNYTPRSSVLTSRINVVAPSGHTTGSCIGDVVTTELVGSPGCQDGPNGNGDYTSTFSGTSAAAPQVSGAAALLLSKYPNLTVLDVIKRIQDTADHWGSANDFGAGKLNIGKLIPLPPPPPPPPIPCEPEPPMIICQV